MHTTKENHNQCPGPTSEILIQLGCVGLGVGVCSSNASGVPQATKVENHPFSPALLISRAVFWPQH